MIKLGVAIFAFTVLALLAPMQLHAQECGTPLQMPPFDLAAALGAESAADEASAEVDLERSVSCLATRKEGPSPTTFDLAAELKEALKI